MDKNEKLLTEKISAQLPKVFNFCLRLTQNPTKALDLSQKIFQKTKIDLLTDEGDVTGRISLYRTAVSIWRNQNRNKKRPRKLTPEEERKIEFVDSNRELYLALYQLDTEQKALIILKDIEGLPYDLIANVVGINKSAVKIKLGKARGQLREKFKRLEGRLV